MKIAFSSSFKRAFKKKVKNDPVLEQKFWDKTRMFIEDPFFKRLRSHKLSGNFKELWSFSIEYDLRVIFYFEDDQEKAVFINLGTHDEVY